MNNRKIDLIMLKKFRLYDAISRLFVGSEVV